VCGDRRAIEQSLPARPQIGESGVHFARLPRKTPATASGAASIA